MPPTPLVLRIAHGQKMIFEFIEPWLWECEFERDDVGTRCGVDATPVMRVVDAFFEEMCCSRGAQRCPSEGGKGAE